MPRAAADDQPPAFRQRGNPLPSREHQEELDADDVSHGHKPQQSRQEYSEQDNISAEGNDIASFYSPAGIPLAADKSILSKKESENCVANTSAPRCSATYHSGPP